MTPDPDLLRGQTKCALVQALAAERDFMGYGTRARQEGMTSLSACIGTLRHTLKLLDPDTTQPDTLDTLDTQEAA